MLRVPAHGPSLRASQAPTRCYSSHVNSSTYRIVIAVTIALFVLSFIVLHCSDSLVEFAALLSWTLTRPSPTSLSPPSFAGFWASSWLAHAGDLRHPLCVKLQCTFGFFRETLCRLILRAGGLSDLADLADLADLTIGTIRRPNALPLPIRTIHGSRRKCWVYFML